MKWFLLLPFWAIINIAARIFAFALPWFAVRGMVITDNNNSFGYEPTLPGWLSWFMTPDNSLWGDAGHKARTPDYKSRAGMAAWLQRNPAVGFEASVLSATLPLIFFRDFQGDPQVQDGPVGKEGYCFVRIGKYWNLVYIKKIPFTELCIKLDLGWQLKTFAEGHTLTTTARYAMSIRFPSFKQ